MNTINVSLILIIVVAAFAAGYPNAIRNWVSSKTFVPAPQASTVDGPMQSGGGGGGGVSLYNVPIIGPDGTPGSIQVDAHDSQSALANATQGGNTPTGPAVAL